MANLGGVFMAGKRDSELLPEMIIENDGASWADFTRKAQEFWK